MLLLHTSHISKEYADRIILTLDDFQLHQGDRVGVVGVNGAGKTTLLDLLSGETSPDTGIIKRYADISYLKQFSLETPDSSIIAGTRISSELVLPLSLESSAPSCGEKIRMRLAKTFESARSIVFLDEPTSNLDASGLAILEKYLQAQETFMLICHDRMLLDAFCNSILEIEQGIVTQFPGNYSQYMQEKARRIDYAWEKYDTYAQERARLEKVKNEQLQSAAKVRKKPRDKGQQIGRENGARSKSTQQKSKARMAKATQSRLDHLEKSEKPRELPKIKLDFSVTSPPENRYVLRINNLHFEYPNRVLFQDLSLAIENGEKVAITGDNGVGKSTLLTLISQKHEAVYTVPRLKIGYLQQDFSQIDMSRTVLENTQLSSVQSATVTRTILARMLFSQKDLAKSAHLLSGGERMRLALVMLILSSNNMLILDEPTNYLDIPSIEALQALLIEYPGTLLFVSHDRSFISAIATRELQISKGSIVEVKTF